MQGLNSVPLSLNAHSISTICSRSLITLCRTHFKAQENCPRVHAAGQGLGKGPGVGICDEDAYTAIKSNALKPEGLESVSNKY